MLVQLKNVKYCNYTTRDYNIRTHLAESHQIGKVSKLSQKHVNNKQISYDDTECGKKFYPYHAKCKERCVCIRLRRTVCTI